MVTGSMEVENPHSPKKKKSAFANMGLDWQMVSSMNVYAYLNLPMSAIKIYLTTSFPSYLNFLIEKD